MPTTISELIWYGFGLLGSYFLWSIRREISLMRAEQKEERDARGVLETKFAAMEARCNERHKAEMSR